MMRDQRRIVAKEDVFRHPRKQHKDEERSLDGRCPYFSERYEPAGTAPRGRKTDVRSVPI
jgi:hypothetical protein